MWYTLFRSGSKNEVDGTWVGDMGHVPKPEGCGESYQSCMACCVSCGSIHDEGRSKVDLFWWLRYGRCHVVSGHFVDYLAWWLWVNYSLMAAKKIWPDGCDELSKHADPGVLRECFHFYSVHCCSFLFFCVCLFVFHGRVGSMALRSNGERMR